MLSACGSMGSVDTHRFGSQVCEGFALAFNIEVGLFQVLKHEFCSKAGIVERWCFLNLGSMDRSGCVGDIVPHVSSF